MSSDTIAGMKGTQGRERETSLQYMVSAHMVKTDQRALGTKSNVTRY